MRSAYLLAAALFASPASAHDIYTNLMGSGGVPCCGGENAGANRDCWRTIYREQGPKFEFRLEDGDWVHVPTDQIQFVPIPGDVEDGISHRAHLCYSSTPKKVDPHLLCCSGNRVLRTVGGAEIALFCAFITPGPL